MWAPQMTVGYGGMPPAAAGQHGYPAPAYQSYAQPQAMPQYAPVQDNPFVSLPLASVPNMSQSSFAPGPPAMFTETVWNAQPRNVFVDRPYPVYEQVPVPCLMPSQVTHKFVGAAPQQVHDFPYHDPAFGVAWRNHGPDDLDAQWSGMPMWKKTPLQELNHEKDWNDLWETARLGENEHSGWRHRRLPFSRRVRNPENLIPKQADFYTELLL